MTGKFNEPSASPGQVLLSLRFSNRSSFTRIKGQSGRLAVTRYHPTLVSADDIEMTEWELQSFAVQVVRDQLVKEGRQLMSWTRRPPVLSSGRY